MKERFPCRNEVKRSISMVLEVSNGTGVGEKNNTIREEEAFEAEGLHPREPVQHFITDFEEEEVRYTIGMQTSQTVLIDPVCRDTVQCAKQIRRNLSRFFVDVDEPSRNDDEQESKIGQLAATFFCFYGGCSRLKAEHTNQGSSMLDQKSSQWFQGQLNIS